MLPRHLELSYPTAREFQMRRFALNISLLAALVPVAACAQDMSPEEMIRSAVSAGYRRQ